MKQIQYFGKTAEFTITETGKTTIIARVGVDEFSSKETKKEINLDNVKPEIASLKLKPELGAGKKWLTDLGQVEITAEDKRRKAETSKDTNIQ